MSTLTDEKVVEIAKGVATTNKVNFTSVLTAPAIDSTGSEAIEIKIVLAPGSSNVLRQAHRSREWCFHFRSSCR